MDIPIFNLMDSLLQSEIIPSTLFDSLLYSAEHNQGMLHRKKLCFWLLHCCHWLRHNNKTIPNFTDSNNFYQFPPISWRNGKTISNSEYFYAKKCAPRGIHQCNTRIQYTYYTFNRWQSSHLIFNLNVNTIFK